MLTGYELSSINIAESAGILVTRNFFSGAANHDLPSRAQTFQNILLYKVDHALAHHSL